MTRSHALLVAGATVAALAIAAYAIRGPDWLGDGGEEQWRLVETYCVECHDSAEAAGGLVFEGMGPHSVALEPEVFETAVRKLRGRLMPPPGGPQPEQARVDSLIAWLERTIDRNAVMPRAGHVPADAPPTGGQAPIRRVLLNHRGEAKTLLELIREKNVQQGRQPAGRADLRFGAGPDDQVFLLNKQDGVVRVLDAVHASGRTYGQVDVNVHGHTYGALQL